MMFAKLTVLVLVFVYNRRISIDVLRFLSRNCRKYIMPSYGINSLSTFRTSLFSALAVNSGGPISFKKVNAVSTDSDIFSGALETSTATGLQPSSSGSIVWLGEFLHLEMEEKLKRYCRNDDS